ncbi:MAG: AAA family ATPase, partial [Eubacteriaceae bacterium]|nr:AAA family ATPase [Eubacteriaceae bacterium]
MGYKKRIIDGLLDINMQAFGATWIKGPKGCGKTTSAAQKAKTVVEFQDEEYRDNLLMIGETSPQKLL